MKKLMIAAMLATALAGCASVQKGDAQLDKELKTFKAPTGDKAGVYIYRNEAFGASVTMDVSIDGKEVGQTAANTYLYKEVAPGKHMVTSKAENTDTLEIETQPGTLTYIWQEVKMGFMYARNKLHLVDTEEGQKGVRETELTVSK